MLERSSESRGNPEDFKLRREIKGILARYGFVFNSWSKIITSNPQLALPYLELAIEILEKDIQKKEGLKDENSVKITNLYKGHQSYCFALTSYFHYKNNKDAIDHLKNAIEFFEEIKDKHYVDPLNEELQNLERGKMRIPELNKLLYFEMREVVQPKPPRITYIS